MGTRTAQKSYIRRYFIFLAKDAEQIPQYLTLFNLKGRAKAGGTPPEETGKSDIRAESAGHSGVYPWILKEFGNGWLKCKERCSLNQISCQRAARAVRNIF